MYSAIKLFVFFPFVLSAVVVNLAYAGLEKIRPVVPSPPQVIYEDAESNAYSRLIQSDRYGEFYFTTEAENDLSQYKKLCKTLGLRKEITNDIKVLPHTQSSLLIQEKTSDNHNAEFIVDLNSESKHNANIKCYRDATGELHIQQNYPASDYIVNVVLAPNKDYKVLLADRITKYSIEIPAVGLLNKKQEIERLILAPEGNILVLYINKSLVIKYNQDNTSLINDLNNPVITSDRKDDMILRFIANAIYSPLGEFSLGKKGKDIVLVAEMAKQKIIIPLSCLNIPLNRLIKKSILNKYFAKENIDDISDKRIFELIYRRTKSFPVNILKRIDEFPLRKDWYIITTPNTCFWTDYFVSYIEGRIKLLKGDIEYQIPFHIHPWYSLQWLLNEPIGRYWLTKFQIHLIPSWKDMEFFRDRYSQGKIYIILSKDIYSDEFKWAIYDNLSSVEKILKQLYLFAKDYEGGLFTEDGIKKAQNLLNDLSDSQADIKTVHTEQKKQLVLNSNINSLLEINKRQQSMLYIINDYKKIHPWSLTNFSFFAPLLNKYLETTGWKVKSSKEMLKTNFTDKEFCYNPELAARMDLALYIMFELCYIHAVDFKKAIKKEKQLVGVLNDIANQLEYLVVKYHHFKRFCEHIRYLASVIRYYIWQWEKEVLIAKEQLQYERLYLNKYNLGFYSNISSNNLKLISSISIDQLPYRHIVDLESLINELSKTHRIKNEEEFVFEFEKRLVKKILNFLI